MKIKRIFVVYWSIHKANAELNKAGKHLLQKEQARAEWINGVSHDVRTPLSIILGYASEIEKNEDASQPVQLQASIIRKQSEKLRSLIADLNLTSRLESNQMMNENQKNICCLLVHS